MNSEVDSISEGVRVIEKGLSCKFRPLIPGDIRKLNFDIREEISFVTFQIGASFELLLKNRLHQLRYK